MRACRPVMAASNRWTSAWVSTVGGLWWRLLRTGAISAARGDLSGQGLVKDSPIKKTQGVQGLPLGGGRHLALSGQVGGKPFHILCPKPVRMGLAAAVMDIGKYPLAIGLLGTVGVVVIAEHLAHLVHEFETGIRAKFPCIFLLTFHI